MSPSCRTDGLDELEEVLGCSGLGDLLRHRHRHVACDDPHTTLEGRALVMDQSTCLCVVTRAGRAAPPSEQQVHSKVSLRRAVNAV